MTNVQNDIMEQPVLSTDEVRPATEGTGPL
jgi:hypothetical protein